MSSRLLPRGDSPGKGTSPYERRYRGGPRVRPAGRVRAVAEACPPPRTRNERPGYAHRSSGRRVATAPRLAVAWRA